MPKACADWFAILNIGTCVLTWTCGLAGGADFGLAGPGHSDMVLTPLFTASAVTCGLMLNVSGGTFSPDTCRFEIITGGMPCRGAGCRPDYAIALKNTNLRVNEIMSVVLFNFREFKTGTYLFDPKQGIMEFKGQLIDKGAVARNLVSGSVSLDVRSNDRVYVSADVHFANDIAVQWSGLMDVKRVSAP
jgi:hypothetical protein